VDTTDFSFEFYSEIPDLGSESRTEAESRLRGLAAGQTDMIGASVAIEQPVHGETLYSYQTRVVVYMRPDNIVAIEKGETVETALRGALDAAERQVRERRDMLREPWKQP
jgi:hypothetical protein